MIEVAGSCGFRRQSWLFPGTRRHCRAREGSVGWFAVLGDELPSTMRTLSRLGIGLSLVFGCLFFAVVAELYYLLWWKKKKISKRDLRQIDYASKTRLLRFFCLRKESSSRPISLNQPEFSSAEANGAGMEAIYGKEGVESELMRLHNLAGPPRFLFTIKEETKEEMDSEGGTSKGGKSRTLSDVLLVPESPFLSPLSSPPLFMDCYSRQGFNPLFESTKEENVSKARSSPPPKFKFLRDAEEKLYQRILMEEAMKVNKTSPGLSFPPPATSPEDGSFITIVVSKSKDQHHHHSTSSQVTPLPSSPPTLQRAKP